jgi:hypothetical protein
MYADHYHGSNDGVRFLVCFWLPLQGWLQLKVWLQVVARLPMMILAVRWPEGWVLPVTALLVTT